MIRTRYPQTRAIKMRPKNHKPGELVCRCWFCTAKRKEKARG